MKRVRYVLLFSLILSIMTGCSAGDDLLSALPGYSSSEYYTTGGFQDYTDYAKYTYDSLSQEDIIATGYFVTMTEADIPNILSYIENFEGWVEIVGGEVEENYDFDKSILSEGDFFYIKTKEGEPIGQSTYGKFDNYSIYFLDVESSVLYYFHSNI